MERGCFVEAGHRLCWESALVIAAGLGLPAHLSGLVALVVFLKHAPLLFNLNRGNMCGR